MMHIYPLITSIILHRIDLKGCWFSISKNQQKTNSVNYRTVSQSMINYQTKYEDRSTWFLGRF